MKNIHLTMTAIIALFCASACCNHADKPESAIGLSETSSADNYTTDSAAGGTALATGTRTKNGYAGAENFSGVMKNTDIPKKIEELIR